MMPLRPVRSRVCRAALLGLLALSAAGLGCQPGGPSSDGAAEAGAPPYDLVLRGGTIVDGTGADRFEGDVAVDGDRIARVSRAPLPADSAERTLDASGLVVAPGFVDNHAHIQTALDDRPLAENFLRQGITTILASLHSGDQPWPLAAYTDSLSRKGFAPNVGFFAGHTWTRRRVLGMDDRPPTGDELEEMKRLVEESMEDGALGLSTGLRYTPAAYAETGEVVELARVASRHGGIYVSHLRDEGPGVVSSVRELIEIADRAQIPAQIQHHKTMGVAQWGHTETTLALVDSAREAGLDIKLDYYPYLASSTSSRVLFPGWALSGGHDSLVARLEDPETRREIEEEMREIFLQERTGRDLSRIQFRTVPGAPAYEGRTLEDLAVDRGLEPTVGTGIDLVIELEREGGFSAIYHVMDRGDLERMMRHDWSMVCTDGDPVGYGRGHPHPRSYGAFPRVLGRYVREEGVLSLEEAVRRMTSMAADQIGQPDRGRIREGAYADLTVFDPDRIEDRASFTDPHRYPVGVIHVLVNGKSVIRDGSLTGRKPGRVLTGPARPEEASR